jgi:hypothetical protein
VSVVRQGAAQLGRVSGGAPYNPKETQIMPTFKCSCCDATIEEGALDHPQLALVDALAAAGESFNAAARALEDASDANDGLVRRTLHDAVRASQVALERSVDAVKLAADKARTPQQVALLAAIQRVGDARAARSAGPS